MSWLLKHFVSHLVSHFVEIGPIFRIKSPALAASAWASYFWPMKTFDEVLECADELPLDQKESLLTVLRHRVAEERRAELIEAVKEARNEFLSGQCRPATPVQIIKKLLS